MFSSFDDFFNDYRIKNNQAPNETVLNVGMLRLKREVRELKTLLDVVLDRDIEEWNKEKFYETDEYVSYMGSIYKSLQDVNCNQNPQRNPRFWKPEHLPTIKYSPDTIFHYNKFIATKDQRTFEILDGRIQGEPCVFVDGIMIDRDQYTYNTQKLIFNKGLQQDQIITVIYGIAYDTGIVHPTQEFKAVEGQFDFVADFKLISPAVFMNGVLLSENAYDYGDMTITLNEPAQKDDVVVIANGSPIGLRDYYTKTTMDQLLSNIYKKPETYSQDETNAKIQELETQIYTDENIVKKDTIYTRDVMDEKLNLKSDLAYVNEELDKRGYGPNLSDHGITNAYVMHEVDALLGLKVSKAELTPEYIENVCKTKQLPMSINVDTLNNLPGDDYAKTVIGNDMTDYLSLYPEKTLKTDKPGIRMGFDDGKKYPEMDVVLHEDADNEDSGRVFNHLNSRDLILNVEGEFKGSFWVNLYSLGIINPDDYNWNVEVHPGTIAGRSLKHDFVPKEYGRGSEFIGFNENETPDASHFYGFVKDNVLKVYSYVELNTTMRPWQAHYKLVGYHKSLSTTIYFNQGSRNKKFIRYPWVNKQEFNETVKGIGTVTQPSPANITSDNNLSYLSGVVSESSQQYKYKSVDKDTFDIDMISNVQQINNDGEAIIYLMHGPANGEFTPTLKGDGTLVEVAYAFDDYGEAKLKVKGRAPFTTPVTVTLNGEHIDETTSVITIPVTPSV